MIFDKYPKYDIDVEKGTIYSLKRNKYIGNFDEYGYCYVFGKGLHRIIWECVNGEIPKGYDIHHKDENPSNNSIYNLELIEHRNHMALHRIGKVNIKHMNKLKKINSKKVMQFTLDGELVKIWDSTMDAERNGFSSRKICDCCNGRNKTHKGFIWKYV